MHPSLILFSLFLSLSYGYINFNCSNPYTKNCASPNNTFTSTLPPSQDMYLYLAPIPGVNNFRYITSYYYVLTLLEGPFTSYLCLEELKNCVTDSGKTLTIELDLYTAEWGMLIKVHRYDTTNELVHFQVSMGINYAQSGEYGIINYFILEEWNYVGFSMGTQRMLVYKTDNGYTNLYIWDNVKSKWNFGLYIGMFNGVELSLGNIVRENTKSLMNPRFSYWSKEFNKTIHFQPDRSRNEVAIIDDMIIAQYNVTHLCSSLVDYEIVHDQFLKVNSSVFCRPSMGTTCNNNTIYSISPTSLLHCDTIYELHGEAWKLVYNSGASKIMFAYKTNEGYLMQLKRLDGTLNYFDFNYGTRILTQLSLLPGNFAKNFYFTDHVNGVFEVLQRVGYAKFDVVGKLRIISSLSDHKKNCVLDRSNLNIICSEEYWHVYYPPVVVTYGKK